MKKNYFKPEVCCKYLDSGKVFASSETYKNRSEKIIENFIEQEGKKIFNCPEKDNE